MPFNKVKIIRFLAIGLMFLWASHSSFAQNDDRDFIKVYGQILNKEDSTTLDAKVFYEKLPYYDDVGNTVAGVDGEFEFYLLNETSYNFIADKNGFSKTSKEVIINDRDEDGLFVFSMYMEPSEESAIISLENLIFARGNDIITESSYEELDELAIWLNDRPSTIIRLEGHTDFAGNAGANMRLSEARVMAVKEYLVKKGVKKKRILTKALGGTQPITTERTDEAKAKNRRVEVRIMNQ